MLGWPGVIGRMPRTRMACADRPPVECPGPPARPRRGAGGSACRGDRRSRSAGPSRARGPPDPATRDHGLRCRAPRLPGRSRRSGRRAPRPSTGARADEGRGVATARRDAGAAEVAAAHFVAAAEGDARGDRDPRRRPGPHRPVPVGHAVRPCPPLRHLVLRRPGAGRDGRQPDSAEVASAAWLTPTAALAAARAGELADAPADARDPRAAGRPPRRGRDSRRVRAGRRTSTRRPWPIRVTASPTSISAGRAGSPAAAPRAGSSGSANSCSWIRPIRPASRAPSSTRRSRPEAGASWRSR